ncbi:FAD:protein FMN transferase [Balneolaceae bacterium ANBcel3]|nr:FAD:protein FMN transferase [Balneolaceae bacterium ANBcel3]
MLTVFVFTFLINMFHVPNPGTARNDVPQNEDMERHEFAAPQMGSIFRIVLYHHDSNIAKAAADSAFRKGELLNSILSDYLPDSELNRLVQTAGKDTAVVVSSHLFELVATAIEVSEETHGAFDLTVRPLTRLWREVRNSPNPKLPSQADLQARADCVGYQDIHLNSVTKGILLSNPCTELDAGGIGKGYAAGKMGEILRSFGIDSFFINAGGDLLAGAPPPGEQGWNIAISAHHPDGTPRPIPVQLSHTALSTSGDLYQFVEIDDVRYSHIIDPKTGMALKDRRTVTVIGPDPTRVDAYSTALSVIPAEKAVRFMDNIPDYHVYIERIRDTEVISNRSEGFKPAIPSH